MSTDHALPLLYSYRRCPYAMRARLAMLQANRRFRTFEIVMRDKPAELLALSPKGTVPVLHLPDGAVLEESLDIMRWAFAPSDAEGWWRLAQTDDNLALLRTNDGEFKRLLDRYKYPDRYPDETAPRETARAQAVETLLLPLESRLRDQRYLGGSTPCGTDLAIFPFVRQFAAVEPAWFASQPLPAVQAWLAGWLGSRLFEVCMTKQPVQAVAVFPAYQHST
ncbi:glutathione S-transferase [Ralstonia soli]|uniref:Glutathione S-transferase n=1 Tax=Ralstonia soli TaxID=2953896 RepID=A0ABT1APS7_9RALS|nr:glutathione S-transferase [Ralstonia soli]MCO5400408.1 glutathione S-transferase [Ralstonia soli]